MGYSNGQLQSQSDSGRGEKGDPGLPGIGFNLTDDGNFDLDGKRLTDVANPVDKTDAATKNYADTEKKEVLFLNGNQSMTGNLDMGDKRTINVETPIDGNDGATKGYVNDQIHLQANKLFDKRTDNTIDLVIPSSQADSL